MSNDSLQKSFVLTVAESKRLIAKGIKDFPPVAAALEDGIVAVAKGTTNAYIVEELLGEKINKLFYCTGTTRPSRPLKQVEIADKLPDLVLRKGERVEGVSATEIVAEMKPDDVFIKGANALNYALDQAGILIGHPTGGTVGAVLGTVIARRVHLVIPVGLEKSVPHDLDDVFQMLNTAGRLGSGPALWPVQGDIFTELEALACSCGVQAVAIGAGGIAGAEGSVRISVWGDEEDMEKVERLLEEVQGEPPFADSA